jgi:uncharacterized protein YtpQ (UPF0354 family)
MGRSWRAPLLAPDLKRESLRESVRLALEESTAVASARALSGDPLGLEVRTREGKTLTVRVDNLFADASRAAPEERERLISQFIKAIVDSAKTLQPSLDQVIPLIKSTDWIAGRPRNDIANEHLVADLYVVYAFDQPSSMQYARWPELDSLARSRGELRQIALANLRTRLPTKLSTHGDNKTFLLVADANHEASLTPSAPGEIVVCVPARDVCLVTGTDIPGGLESLVAARDRTCAGGALSNFISKTLLRRSGKVWVAFHEPL